LSINLLQQLLVVLLQHLAVTRLLGQNLAEFLQCRLIPFDGPLGELEALVFGDVVDHDAGLANVDGVILLDFQIVGGEVFAGGRGFDLNGDHLRRFPGECYQAAAGTQVSRRDEPAGAWVVERMVPRRSQGFGSSVGGPRSKMLQLDGMCFKHIQHATRTGGHRVGIRVVWSRPNQIARADRLDRSQSVGGVHRGTGDKTHLEIPAQLADCVPNRGDTFAEPFGILQIGQGFQLLPAPGPVATPRTPARVRGRSRVVVVAA